MEKQQEFAALSQYPELETSLKRFGEHSRIASRAGALAYVCQEMMEPLHDKLRKGLPKDYPKACRGASLMASEYLKEELGFDADIIPGFYIEKHPLVEKTHGESQALASKKAAIKAEKTPLLNRDTFKMASQEGEYNKFLENLGENCHTFIRVRFEEDGKKELLFVDLNYNQFSPEYDETPAIDLLRVGILRRKYKLILEGGRIKHERKFVKRVLDPTEGVEWVKKMYETFKQEMDEKLGKRKQEIRKLNEG